MDIKYIHAISVIEQWGYFLQISEAQAVKHQVLPKQLNRRSSKKKVTKECLQKC